MSKPFIGAWSGNTPCGKGFKFIALASALPQDWKDYDPDPFFTNYIVGGYDTVITDTKTKYLLSVGGSNAGNWNPFLNANVDILYNEIVSRGLSGIDYDIEAFQGDPYPDQQKIINQVKALKALNPEFIIQYTVLVGFPRTYNQLLEDNSMDYVAIMLYNGGMYTAVETGAGCDWDGWAELFLSECNSTNGCPMGPLMVPKSQYCAILSDNGKYPNALRNMKGKTILGIIYDTPGKRVTLDDIKKTMNLCKQYGGVGIYFWVLPGWTDPNTIDVICDTFIPAMIEYNKTIGNYFEINSCEIGDCKSGGGSGGGGFPEVCSTDIPSCKTCSGKCIATECGKFRNGATDETCAPCLAGGQSWWPCDVPGACQCSSGSYVPPSDPDPDDEKEPEIPSGEPNIPSREPSGKSKINYWVIISIIILFLLLIVVGYLFYKSF